MKRHLRSLKAIAFATYKEWAAYRTHMWVSLFVGPVYFGVQYFIWSSVYRTGSSIGGMVLNDTLRYYGISAVIGYLTFDFAEWNVQMLIHTGKYTSFLQRPVSHVYFALCQKVGHRTLGFVNEFLPVCFLFFFIFKINLLPSNIIYGVITILLSFILRFLINYSIGLSAFWLTRSGGVSGIFNLIGSVCSGSIVPLSFLPLGLQRVMMFLPFQYTTFVPVQIFIGQYRLGGISIPGPVLLLLQLASVLLMLCITLIIEKMGIKKYTGVGA